MIQILQVSALTFGIKTRGGWGALGNELESMCTVVLLLLV
jgi:hypothetical protein